MAAAATYFGNYARAAVVPAGTSYASVALADLFTVDRGFEVTLGWETAELYGTDSVLRVDEAKHTVRPVAKLKGCKFYPDNSGTGGIMDMILNTLNGAASGSGAIADTNAVYLMDVYIWQTLKPAGVLATQFSLEVLNAYIDGVTFPFPENDFITLDLTFKGRTGALGTRTYPAA
jgi:hypothetical protein